MSVADPNLNINSLDVNPDIHQDMVKDPKNRSDFVEFCNLVFALWFVVQNPRMLLCVECKYVLREEDTAGAAAAAGMLLENMPNARSGRQQHSHQQQQSLSESCKYFLEQYNVEVYIHIVDKCVAPNCCVIFPQYCTQYCTTKQTANCKIQQNPFKISTIHLELILIAIALGRSPPITKHRPIHF